jgi:hypothetical protein
MSTPVPLQGATSSDIWPVKKVGTFVMPNSGEVFPQVSPNEPAKGRIETLAQAATHYLTATLLDNGYYLAPVKGEKFGDACFAQFLTFSEDTLITISQLGVNAATEGDAVYEYDCLYMLVSAQAEEADFINVLAMGDFLADREVFDGDDAIALTLPLKLYDEHIREVTGRALTTLEERMPYYEALVGVTIALENAITSLREADSSDDDNEEAHEDDEDYTPTILYCEIAPDQSSISSSPVIGDQRISALVIRNVDRADEINAFIKERFVLDSDVINEYLTTYPSAVANGSL